MMIKQDKNKPAEKAQLTYFMPSFATVLGNVVFAVPLIALACIYPFADRLGIPNTNIVLLGTHICCAYIASRLVLELVIYFLLWLAFRQVK